MLNVLLNTAWNIFVGAYAQQGSLRLLKRKYKFPTLVPYSILSSSLCTNIVS